MSSLAASEKKMQKKEQMRHVILEQPHFGETVLETQPLPIHMDIAEDRSKSYHFHLTIVSEAFSPVNICFLGTGHIIWHTTLSRFKHVPGCLSFPSWVKL